MDINSIKKDLLKTKVIAKFNNFFNGKLYYNVDVLGNTYQFPIDTVELTKVTVSVNVPALPGQYGTEVIIPDIYVKAADVSGAKFTVDMRGSELMRWITKAIASDNFVCLTAAV